MDVTFHYPHDLLELLVEVIPRLSKSKKGQLLFFQGAGVSKSLYADLEAKIARDRDSVNRYEIARTILTRLNERGEGALRERREVLKRVLEFEDFTGCWENDRLPAQGLMAQIRALVNAKDSFTRMKDARDAELRYHQAEQERKVKETVARRAELDRIKQDLYALFAEPDAQRRGKALERVLNDLFRYYGILVKEAFTRAGAPGEGIIEQVDGVIELDGEIYLVEMKWWNRALGPGEVAQHLTRVFGRADCRGFMISASSYTPAAVQQYREALHLRTVFLCDLEEIVRILDEGTDFVAFLKKKVEAAIVHKNPHFRPSS